MLSRTLRTVLSVLVARVRSASGAGGSCPWSGDVGAGFLMPSGLASGRGGPMPRGIALVLRGRCRPSPDAVPEGASSNGHGGGVMPRSGDTEVGRTRNGGSHLNYALYHDRYQRASDGWKFTERVHEVRYLDTTPLAGSAPHTAPGVYARIATGLELKD
jgi:hypothetical protein